MFKKLALTSFVSLLALSAADASFNGDINNNNNAVDRPAQPAQQQNVDTVSIEFGTSDHPLADGTRQRIFYTRQAIWDVMSRAYVRGDALSGFANDAIFLAGLRPGANPHATVQIFENQNGGQLTRDELKEMLPVLKTGMGCLKELKRFNTSGDAQDCMRPCTFGGDRTMLQLTSRGLVLIAKFLDHDGSHKTKYYTCHGDNNPIELLGQERLPLVHATIAIKCEGGLGDGRDFLDLFVNRLDQATHGTIFKTTKKNYYEALPHISLLKVKGVKGEDRNQYMSTGRQDLLTTIDPKGLAKLAELFELANEYIMGNCPSVRLYFDQLFVGGMKTGPKAHNKDFKPDQAFDSNDFNALYAGGFDLDGNPWKASTEVNYSSRQLVEFPNLGSSRGLTVIDLSNNRISTCPNWIEHHKALEILDLSNNRLETLPWDKLMSLPKLRVLDISGNPVLLANLAKVVVDQGLTKRKADLEGLISKAENWQKGKMNSANGVAESKERILNWKAQLAAVKGQLSATLMDRVIELKDRGVRVITEAAARAPAPIRDINNNNNNNNNNIVRAPAKAPVVKAVQAPAKAPAAVPATPKPPVVSYEDGIRARYGLPANFSLNGVPQNFDPNEYLLANPEVANFARERNWDPLVWAFQNVRDSRHGRPLTRAEAAERKAGNAAAAPVAAKAAAPAAVSPQLAQLRQQLADTEGMIKFLTLEGADPSMTPQRKQMARDGIAQNKAEKARLEAEIKKLTKN